MSYKEKRAALITQANSLLSKPNYSMEDKSRFDSLMSLADAFVGVDDPTATDENRSTKNQVSQHFREMLLGGDREYRTYTGLDISGNGSGLVAAEFEKRLVETQMSAGPLYAGSPALTNLTFKTNAPLRLPICDDISATGYVQADQTAVIEAELATVGAVSLGTTTFSSGIVLGSVELILDLESWTTFEGLLLSSLGKRLSRIQNKTWLASLITSLAANSSATVAAETSTAVSYNDCVNLCASVNAQYRYSDKAAFIFNSSTQRSLAELKDSQGHPIVEPSLLASRPTLFGYPVYVSDFADTAASGKNPVIFGDLSYIYTRSLESGFDLQVLKEQFAVNGYIGTILRKRADMQYAVPTTADSAIKVLHNT